MIIQKDLDNITTLFTLYKKEFSSIIKTVRDENPILINVIDFIRVSFDPYKSQYVVALIILNALKLNKPINNPFTITKICMVNAVQTIATFGVDHVHVTELILEKLGKPILTHIQYTGLNETVRLEAFKSGHILQKDCISFTSLFFIYHAIREAVIREKKINV